MCRFSPSLRLPLLCTTHSFNAPSHSPTGSLFLLLSFSPLLLLHLFPITSLLYVIYCSPRRAHVHHETTAAAQTPANALQVRLGASSSLRVLLQFAHRVFLSALFAELQGAGSSKSPSPSPKDLSLTLKVLLLVMMLPVALLICSTRLDSND